MRKLFGLTGFIILVLGIWYIDMNNPDEKKIMSKETRKSWNKSMEDIRELSSEVKAQFKKDTTANKIRKTIKDNTNPTDIGKKLKKTVEYLDENVKEPTKDYLEEVYDGATE